MMAGPRNDWLDVSMARWMPELIVERMVTMDG